ncbi:MAG: hypothetical protein UR89_C0029G0006 [Candidatus Roizmanbacteria bacterium GW2011_GWA2_35_8]|uniref:Uncharacterized protein n=1 Tax=Candidatus Roizmanbacteria bacterium GW2011_GWA2_35_8 TaxID=1618479 RepID=A0A0G0DC59_9BACT|nr:MAG: hypothetical protein UR89_C0029G0006 [Candidatus Roizmanbacteria bacterium GW2011_GWA2_35_8]
MFKFVVVAIMSVTTFISTPYRYYQSYKLNKTANILSTQNKNEEALKKYEEAQKMWNNEEINGKIQDVKEDIENNKFYQEGSNYIDDKKWEEAIISLSKVREPSKHYESAQLMIDLAIEKMRVKEEESKIEKPEVKGVNTYLNETNNIEKISNPTPTIYVYATPIPTQSNISTQTIIHLYPMATNTPMPTPDTRQRDSYGNLCTSYLSHCKYGCSIKDSDIDYRINTISMHNNQLDICKKNSSDCSIWENALKTDFTSLTQYCGSDFLNY